jgi:hypothetical protein
MKKTILFLVSLCLVALLQAQVSKTVNVTAGVLSAALTTNEKNTVTNLTIKGTIDARDFRFMRDSLPMLAVLDIEDVDVVAYTGSGGTDFLSGNQTYNADAIPQWAFSYDGVLGKNSLLSINLPNSITRIENTAFHACRNLTSIPIPSNVNFIGRSSFSSCSSIDSINIPASVTFIDFAFLACGGLFTVDPNNQNYSSKDFILFNKDQTELIHCPTSIKGNYIVPNSVTSIAQFAFAFCSHIKSIKIPEAVGVIEQGVFVECDSLTSVNIPDSANAIGASAFSGCHVLPTIAIPSSVSSIGYLAFSRCDELNSIYAYPITPVDLSSSPNVFRGVDKTTCTLYVPSSSKHLYETADQWKDFMHIVEMESESIISNVRKISATQGGFTGQLDANDLFGHAKVIGDVDGDGIEDMAVGAIYDDDGGTDHGAVWILFMNKDRSVKGHQKISSTQGGFAGQLDFDDKFGLDISSIGDFNNDGVVDIAVGAFNDDDSGNNSGAVWLLFLNANGTVKSHQKISGTQGNVSGVNANHQFGTAVKAIGDLNGDGITDLAVGSPTYNDNGGTYRGAVYILFLNSNGTVKSQTIINDFRGGFTGHLDDGDRFGAAITNMGDINGDGIVDIAVHALYDDDGAANAGAIYVLFLNYDGTVKHTQKISALEGGFNGTNGAGDLFGCSMASLGDIDGDGVNDLLTSSFFSDEGGNDIGKVWILNLNSDATVKRYNEINYQNTELIGLLEAGDNFGVSVSVFSGLNENGKKEITIGAWGDDDGFTDAGAVYILDLGVANLLTLSKNTIDFLALGGDETIALNANVSWTASSDQSWLSVTPASGTANGSLSITAAQNIATSPRSAIVTVTGQGVAPKTITITQQQAANQDSYLSVEPTTVTITGSTGSKGTFDVISNVTWSAESNQTWVKLSPKNSSGTKTVTVTASNTNPNITPRSAIVTVSTDGLPAQRVTVIQAAGDTSLTVTNNVINIGAAEGSSAWTGVTSNTTWNAVADQLWLSLTPSEATGNRNLVFTAQANPTISVRTATVTVSGIGATTQTITVIQAAKSGISIETDTIYIAKEEGSTVQIPIAANISWRAVQDETWLSVEPGSGLGDGVITLTATANPTVGKRSAVVSISGVGVGILRLTVIQEAADPRLSISGTAFLLPKEGGSISTALLTSNMNWNASADQSWLTVAPLTGFGDKMLTFAAGTNPTTEERSATVTVTGLGVEPVVINVIQEAGDAYLTLPATEIHLGYEEGSTATIGITSNASWTISTADTWLSAVPASGSGDAIITFTAKENPSQMDRLGSVSFSIVGGDSNEIVAIQLAKPVSAGLIGDEKRVTLYPNPVTEGFRVKGIEGIADISITDLSGRVCLKKQIHANEVIPSVNLTKGIYLVRVADGNGIIEMKLIKE